MHLISCLQELLNNLILQIMKLKTICFDIDNVICRTDRANNYSKSIPIKKI